MGHRSTGRDREFQGPPTELPAPITAPDGHDEPSGAWAQYIHTLNFRSASHNLHIKTPFLRWLRGQRMFREPTLRRGFNYTSGYFFTQLNNRTANIEATYMQTVGDIQSRPYNHCLSEYGPFTTCVKVPGYHEIECYAGCHRWNQDHGVKGISIHPPR
ncbi:hypothetical protein N7488_012266 [Penicillium malachiteum]|nr:hypothetical protein N7488_012266 [Penicillium malachiteum]